MVNHFFKMETKAFFIELTEYCKNTKSKSILSSQVWEFMYEQAKTHLRCFGALFNLFHEYCQITEDFRSSIPESILEDIHKLKTIKDEGERTLLCQNLITISSFLPIDLILEVLDSSIDIVYNYYQKNMDFPYEFISAYDNFVIEVLDDDDIDKLLSKLKDLMTQEKFSSIVMIFSCIAHDLLEIQDDKLKFVISIFQELMKGENDKIIAGCYLMENIACHFEHTFEDVPEPEIIFNILRKLLVSNDNKIMYRAHKCTRELIKAQMFSNLDIVKAIIEQFPDYSFENHGYFFKLLKSYLKIHSDHECSCDCDSSCCSEEDGFDMELIDFIFKYALDSYKNSSNNLLKARYIDLLGEISILVPDIFEDDYEEVLNSAIEIVNNDVSDTYIYISSFFISVFSNYQTKKFADVLPKLASIIFDEKNDKKYKILLGIDIAQLVGSLEIKEMVPQIVKFILDNIDSIEINDSLRASGMIIGIHKLLEKEEAIKIFIKLHILATKTSKFEAVNMIVHIMNNLLEEFDIYEVSYQFINDIIYGKLPIFEGTLPYLQIPSIDSLFDFMTLFIEKYQMKSETLVNTLLNWFYNGPELSLPQILNALHPAIINNSIDDKNCYKLALEILSQFEKLDKSDTPEIIACSDAIAAIYKSNQTILSPITKFTSPFEALIKSFRIPNLENDEEENEEEEEEENREEEESEVNDESAPSIIRFLLDVYTTDESYNIDDIILLKFFEFFPFSKEEGMEAIIKAIDKVIFTDPRFKNIKTPIGVLYAQMLIQDTETDFEEETITEMKDILKKLLKGNLQLKTNIASYFKGKDARKFRNLFK